MLTETERRRERKRTVQKYKNKTIEYKGTIYTNRFILKSRVYQSAISRSHINSFGEKKECLGRNM
jgi:hypothetical protein